MRNRLSRIVEAAGMLGRYAPLNMLLVCALGFLLVCNQASLLAQDSVVGTKVSAPAPSPVSPRSVLTTAQPPSEYLINPGDVLDVYVFDVPELTHAYTVSLSGDINMPLLPEPVHAAGLRSEQLARAMEEAFRQSGRLKRPEISISLAKASISSSVAVEGAVKNPQIVPEMGRTRLVDVITQCGGLTDDAGDVVTIVRGPLATADLAREGGPMAPTLSVDLKKIMDVSDPASSTAVWPGDRVTLERRKPDVYYVLGEVKSPGGYTIKYGDDELTVLRAVALAGDVSGVAKKNGIFIIRKDPSAPRGREEIKLDLQSILKGRTPDPKVQAEDILFVPGSAGKRALHTLESAPAMIATDAAVALLLH